MPARLDAKHTEAVLIIVERHALDNAREHVLRRLLCLRGGYPRPYRSTRCWRC